MKRAQRPCQSPNRRYRFDDMPKFEYAPAPESRAIVSLKESYGLFINGEFTPSADGRAFKTISPATEEVLAEVAEAGAGGGGAAGGAGPPGRGAARQTPPPPPRGGPGRRGPRRARPTWTARWPPPAGPTSAPGRCC